MNYMSDLDNWDPHRDDNWRVCCLCEGWLPEYGMPGLGLPCACRGLDNYLERLEEEDPEDFLEFGPGIAEEHAQQRAEWAKLYVVDGPMNHLDDNRQLQIRNRRVS